MNIHSDNFIHSFIHSFLIYANPVEYVVLAGCVFDVQSLDVVLFHKGERDKKIENS